jgi:hypothetical protein
MNAQVAGERRQVRWIIEPRHDVVAEHRDRRARNSGDLDETTRGHDAFPDSWIANLGSRHISTKTI